MHYHLLNAPDSLHNQVMYVKYKVIDKKSRHIADHSIKLIPKGHNPEFHRNIKTNNTKVDISDKKIVGHSAPL